MASEPGLYDGGRISGRRTCEHLVPLDTFESKVEIGRFRNVALLVGLTARGPNLAGGSVFDDFTGDGLPDLYVNDFTSTLAEFVADALKLHLSRKSPPCLYRPICATHHFR